MPAVQVTFGANIQGLVDGVEDAKSAIKLFMEAFAVEKIADFADQYARLGEQIEVTARQFGQSTTQVQELGYVAAMVGGNQQELTRSLGRLQAQLALAGPEGNRVTAALTALGLSSQELKGKLPQEQLALVADAFAKYADGTNKAAIAQVLFRNSSGELISALDGGRAGLEAMYEQAEQTGAVMSGQTVGALANLDHAAIGLRASLSALSGELVAVASGALSSFANALAQSAGNMTKLIETGQLGSYALAYMQHFAEELTAQLGKLALAVADIFTGNWGEKFTADMKAADAIIEATATHAVADLDARLKAASDSYKELIGSAGEGVGKPQAPSIDMTGKDQLSAQLETINAQKAALDTYYQSQVEHINSLAKTFQITEQQKTQMLQQQIAQRVAAEEAWVQSGLQLQGLTAAQYEKLQDQLTKIELKGDSDRQKAADEAAKEETKAWKSAADQIAGAINGQLKAILSGHETLKQGLINISGQIALKFIEDQIKVTVEWLAEQARILAGHIATETGMTAATTAGAAMRAAANTAAGQTSILADIANALKAIFAGAAQTTAGVAANVAPVAGPAAPAIGAAAGAAVVASATGMLYEQGTDQVLRGGLAILHPGEMVVPAGMSTARGTGPYTGGSVTGGGVTHNWNMSVSAVDARSFMSYINTPQFKTAFNRMLGNSNAGFAIP